MAAESLQTTQRPRLIIDSGGSAHTVELYSREGLELLAQLWVKAAAQHKVMYEPTWMGVPIIQFPTDILMMQELMWKVQPDVIVECGVAHGGSAVFYASICELLGKGRVLGVEIDFRAHNRAALETHPMRKRIDIVDGSSTDPAVVKEVKRRVGDAERVLVVLDSNHSTQHVLRELDAYHDLVTPGSYLVAMDGAQAHVWDIPRGKLEWKDDNPLAAIRQWLPRHPEFRPDPSFTRMLITSNPEGFLRRITSEERAVP